MAPAAALDTLLAISIDLSMDTVAYRLHMWHWDWRELQLNPLTAQWFGIPFGNFFGWQMVVFFYSSISRLLERAFMRQETARRMELALVPLLAVLLSQVLLFSMLKYVDDFLHRQFGIVSLHRFIVFGIILIVMVIHGLPKAKPVRTVMPLITWLVPVWFHCFFFSWLFIAGFYKENIWMLLAATLNILIGIGIHLFGVPKRHGEESVVIIA